MSRLVRNFDKNNVCINTYRYEVIIICIPYYNILLVETRETLSTHIVFLFTL